MNYTDVKYINQISPRLSLFKKRGNNVWNFRCPLCGDSRQNKTKARGYIYQKDASYWFACHNGCRGRSLANFISEIDPETYKHYCLEKFGNKKTNQEPEDNDFKTNVAKRLDNAPKWMSTAIGKLPKVSDLEPSHISSEYARTRLIPKPYLSKLFYAEAFYAFCNELVPGKFPNIKYDEPRLVIPMITHDGRLFGFQGRSFKKNSNNKYLTIMLTDREPRVYGLDTVDFKKPVYVLEGPINSMFVDNSIAMVGAEHKAIAERFPDVDFVYMYDNEPRSEVTVQKIEDCVNSGYKVVLLPTKYETSLDINDHIKRGVTKETLMEDIERSTYQGIMAKLRLAMWRKDI